MVLAAASWNISLWGNRPDPLSDIYTVVVGAMIFLVIGIYLISRIRGQREHPKARHEESSMSLFQRLYKEKLITYDEYQTIKKNLRDHLVYEVYEKDLVRTAPGRKSRGKGTFSDKDKEERLRQLLSGKK